MTFRPTAALMVKARELVDRSYDGPARAAPSHFLAWPQHRTAGEVERIAIRLARELKNDPEYA